MKKCDECKKYKPLTDYNKYRLTKDGLRTWCKACYSIYNKERLHIDRQYKYELRAKAGDKAIAVCRCGDYYKWLYFIGTCLTPKSRANCLKCHIN